VLLSVYTVAGLIYGFSAWVLIGRAGTASPNAIVGANLETITAVVIGGTSLFGGRGGIPAPSLERSSCTRSTSGWLWPAWTISCACSRLAC
jgi:hypothetical protein